MEIANETLVENVAATNDIAQQQFFKRNENAAVRTLFELETAAGAKVTQDAESVLDNLSSLVCIQKEEFGTRKCKYVPLSVMKSVWMVKTGGHGREISEETTYSKETDTVIATVVLGDGFGGEYRTMREKPVDRSGFDTEVAQILRAKDLIRGTAWSACYASVQANNGYSKVYLDDTAEDVDAKPVAAVAEKPALEPTEVEPAPKKKRGRPKKETTEPVTEGLPVADKVTVETEAIISEPISESDALSTVAEEPPIQEETPTETQAGGFEEQGSLPEKPAVQETEITELPFTETTPEISAAAVTEESKEAKEYSWPAGPLHEISYEDALKVMSPTIHRELGEIVGITKPGVGCHANAVYYIEKAALRGKVCFDDEDMNAMLVIIANNEDMKAEYDIKREEAV